MAANRIGIWLIGAKGGVASAATVGIAALQKGLIGTSGLVSELPEFSNAGLADWNSFVVGGHEIRDVDGYAEVERLHRESRVVSADVLAQCKDQLDAVNARIRPGTLLNVGETIADFAGEELKTLRETPRQAIDRITADLEAFATENKLDHVVVVNVSSTEPTVDASKLPTGWSELDALIDRPGDCPLPASSLYAIAALGQGCSFLNFTPSLGSDLPALDELARERGTRHMGCDGKTGETLLKSTLAPMFAKRHLDVMSWVGHNIFGNLDGKVLDDPVNKRSKVVSKDRLLGQILGYSPQTLVSIEYIESLGDWKTAWDHIHFTGFLGTPMTFQFIWQGCDSLLAAPLVLDLVRFTERAWRNGDTGLLTFLSAFFKSPLGITEHDFGLQHQMLQAWVAGLGPDGSAKA